MLTLLKLYIDQKTEVMLKTILIMLAFLPWGSSPEAEQEIFLNKLKAYCGGTYQGSVVFPEGDKDPFYGKELSMHIASCGENEVKIPFRVGEDRSRTWVLSLDDKGLLLKHDHRHEDGSPDEITMYGGYASEQGTSLAQHFPADDYTAALLPAAATNEWTMMLSEDGHTFSYILKRDGELRFRADFNLAQ